MKDDIGAHSAYIFAASLHLVCLLYVLMIPDRTTLFQTKNH